LSYVLFCTFLFFYEILNQIQILFFIIFFWHFQISQVFFVIQTDCSKNISFFRTITLLRINRLWIVPLPKRILWEIIILKCLSSDVLVLINMITICVNWILNLTVMICWRVYSLILLLLWLKFFWRVILILRFETLLVVNIWCRSLRFFVYDYNSLQRIVHSTII